MSRMFAPKLVAVIDSSGLPILTLPRVEDFKLVSGVVSAIMGVSKMIMGGDIDYIKTDKGIFFIKPIENKGSFLMFFENVDDPKKVGWIVFLFLNELRDKIVDMLEGLITDSALDNLADLYHKFVQHLNLLMEIVDKVIKNFNTLKNLAGKMVNNMISKCSEGVFDIENEEVTFATNLIVEKNMTIKELLKIIEKCYNDLRNQIKKFIG